MPIEDIKTPYQQRHNLPSTYAPAAAGHLHGLHRISLVKNPKYVPSPLNSLGHLIKKFQITPTLPCHFAFLQDLIVNSPLNPLQHLQPGTHAPSTSAVGRVFSTDGSSEKVQAENVQNDSEYLAQVGVGTPVQMMNLNFDTGSSDLWLWSTSLPKNTQDAGRTTGHHIFDPSKSSTWKASPNQTWTITYGDGSSASGSVGTDTVTIGGLSVENQAVELATTIATSFEGCAGDGLLGLAFGTINTVQPQPVHTPVENMVLQADIPKGSELFTAYLTNRIDKVPPFYTFGYIDQEALAGQPPHYTPIDNSKGFWQIHSPHITINGTKHVISGGNNTGIMDTGTTLALIDDESCRAIYAAIPGSKYDPDQGGFVYPSNTPRNRLPVLRVAIGDCECVVDPDDVGFAEVGGGMRYGGWQSRGNMAFSIFGGSLLKSMYAVFDQGAKRFGWVQRADLQGETSSRGK